MPWSKDNLPNAAKNLPERWKSLWVQVANEALRSCKSAGKADCEGSAIRQASGVVAKRMKESEERRYRKMKNKAIDIIEETDVPFADAKIRPETNYIESVAILGHESKNRRRYPPHTMRQASKMLEGTPAYADHPQKKKMNEPRGVRELIGRYCDVKYNTSRNKVVGDLEVLENQAEWVFPIAKQMPEMVGLSINARGKVYRDKEGWEIVEEFTEILSADLVTEPATNISLFEEKEMDYDKLTIEELKNNHPELIQELREQLLSEIKTDNEENNMSEELIKKLNQENAELKEALKVKGEESDKFKEETEKTLKENATKIDELETEKKLKEEAEAREKLIAEKLKEAKLVEGLVSETFMDNLREAKDEAEVDKLIEDRKALRPKAKDAKTESKEKEEGNIDFTEENVENVFGLPKKEDK